MHLADAGFSPLAKSHPRWDPVVVNAGGGWQRTVTAADCCTGRPLNRCARLRLSDNQWL
jgi:hypothetical protein